MSLLTDLRVGLRNAVAEIPELQAHIVVAMGKKGIGHTVDAVVRALQRHARVSGG